MSEDEIILTHVLDCSRIDLHLNKPVLTPKQQQRFDEYVARRKAGEPLQYILGVAHFYGLEFKVNPAVLVPRPETEILVEEALRRFKGSSILDIGTGSGNIAVTLAKHIPQARVTAIDISEDALAVARENARAHGVADRIDFVRADILQGFASGQAFDMVVSNPPYIPSEQIASLPADVQKEPRMALDGGEDGLKFCQMLIKSSPPLLRKGGCLMMEFGDGQGFALRALCEQTRAFSHIEILHDLNGKERILHGKVRH
jgi:release factor glutamine methyltransferase